MSAVQLRVSTALAIMLWSSGVAAQPQRQPATPNAQAREIFRELVETRTTEQDGGTAKAAEAIVNRLLAAGFPADDVQIVGPNPRAPCVIARYRGSHRAARPVLFMAHMDVVPERAEDWSVAPYTLLERDGWFYGRG